MLLTRSLTADRGDEGLRLDLVIRRHLHDIRTATRTRIQTWIESGHVTVNGRPVHRVASRAALGDVVTVVLQDEQPRAPMAAEPVGLRVLYEDRHLLAIDKPVGVVVHPSYKHAAGTILNALLWHARDWTEADRPSIVGRLDKLTSGIVVVAKSAAAHAALQRAMTAGGAEKDYLAVVYGRVKTVRGEIDLRLSRDVSDRRKVVTSAVVGAPSLTRFERLARVAAPNVGLALLRCQLATGRTHQIRAHLSARGWPLVGDGVYGEPCWSRIADPALGAALKAFPRQALHAWRLAITHPFTGDRLAIEAPLPGDITQLLAAAGIPWPLPASLPS